MIDGDPWAGSSGFSHNTAPGRHEVSPEFSRDIGDYYRNYDMIQKYLGWQPRVDLRQGLANSIDYYRKHQEQYWAPE